VATTVLSPAQKASPIRGLLKNQRNTTVILGEVGGVNKDAKCVYVSHHEQKDARITFQMGVSAFPHEKMLRSIELVGTRVAANVRKQLTTVLSHGVF